MGERSALLEDRLVKPTGMQAGQEAENPMRMMVRSVGGSPADSSAVGSSSSSSTSSSAMGMGRDSKGETAHEGSGEDEPLLMQDTECRICQEEDRVSNFETPCACSGSLKYAHRKCVQRWCNEKGDTICEICKQHYQPGYTAPPPARPEEATIELGGVWTISGTPLDLHDPHLIAIAEAEHDFLEAEYVDYAASSASGAALCRSAALILMALFLMRHALTTPDSDDSDDASTFFTYFLLRAAGFLLPCYIMAWAISILQQRRERQEAAALAAAQMAFVLQAGGHNSHRGLHFTIAPPTIDVVPHHETV